MTPIDTTPSKSEILLKLSIAAHAPDPLDADAKMRLRKGFDALMDAVRKVDGIPAADIDQFIQDARAGAGADVLMVPAVLFATALPDQDYYAAMVGSGMFAGMTDQVPPLQINLARNPKFVSAMKRIEQLHEQHGPAAAEELPECKDLWLQVFDSAPPEFMQILSDTAKEFDLLPETKFVNDAGEPVFSAQQVADKLGIPVEQVEKDIREKFGDRLVPPGNVHLVQ